MTNSRYYKGVFNHFDIYGNGMISPSELQRCVRLIYDEEILLEEVEVVVELPNRNHENLGFEDEKLEDLRTTFSMYEMDGTDCITPKSLNLMKKKPGEITQPIFEPYQQRQDYFLLHCVFTTYLDSRFIVAACWSNLSPKFQIKSSIIICKCD
ncbi:unnamed protein product [Lactuca saligna]|uniref:EF-hand domain-containing protein n=1 Tax=Lactuca saligna TaxID=75948 RepID=A0AA35YH75_LACSI|nr:unnamed protein product [Lactuca saligna]